MSDVVSVVTKNKDKDEDGRIIKIYDNFLDHNDRDNLENGLFNETFP